MESGPFLCNILYMETADELDVSINISMCYGVSTLEKPWMKVICFNDRPSPLVSETMGYIVKKKRVRGDWDGKKKMKNS